MTDHTFVSIQSSTYRIRIDNRWFVIAFVVKALLATGRSRQVRSQLMDRYPLWPGPPPSAERADLSPVATLQIIKRDLRLPSAKRACQPKEDRQEREEHGRQDEEDEEREKRHQNDDRLDQKQVHER